MSASVFHCGDTVYLDDGREAVYVVAVPNGGHVAQPTSDFGDDEPGTLDEPVYVPRVHAQPKMARLHAEVREVEAKLSKLREETSAAHSERYRMERESKAIIERLSKRHAALTHIEAALDGKLTHAAVWSGYCDPGFDMAVKPIAEVVKSTDVRERDLRLLALYGNDRGDAHWHLHHYSDSSGGSSAAENVRPFPSEAEALAFARERVASLWQKAQAEGDWKLQSLVTSAKRLGVAIPDGIEARLATTARAAAEKKAAEAARLAEAARQALEALS